MTQARQHRGTTCREGTGPDYVALLQRLRYVRKVVGVTKPVWAVAQAHLLASPATARVSPGFDHSVPSKFRSRLIEAGGEGFASPPYVCNRALRVNLRRKTSDRPMQRLVSNSR